MYQTRPGTFVQIIGMCALCVLCVFVYVCVYLLPRLLIASDMIWMQYNWFIKSYSLLIAAVVSIISGWGLSIDVPHGNQLTYVIRVASTVSF